MSNPPRWFPALAAGIALAVVAAASWPVAIAPSGWVIGAGDNDFASIAWSFHHAAWSLLHGQLPIGQTQRLMYPTGASIAVAALPEGALLAPVTRMAGATVTFNVVQAAHVALAAAAGAWCAAKIGADRAGAALLAVACGACPALLGAAYNQNPDVTPMFGVPLVYGLARGRPVAAGLAAGAIAWCNPYCGLMAGIAGLAMVVSTAFGAPARSRPVRVPVPVRVPERSAVKSAPRASTVRRLVAASPRQPGAMNRAATASLRSLFAGSTSRRSSPRSLLAGRKIVRAPRPAVAARFHRAIHAAPKPAVEGGRLVAAYVAATAVLGLPYAASVAFTTGSGGAVHRWVGGVLPTVPWALLSPRPSAGKTVDTAYLGVSLLLLAAWGARTRRIPGLWAMLAAGIALTLGPRLGVVPLPGMILEWTPIGALRIASRFSMLVVFALGAQAALAVSGRRWRWIAVLAVAADLLLLADGLGRLASRRTPLLDACAAVRVVDGPAAYVPFEATDRGLFLATCHDQPVADGLKGQVSQASRRAQRGPPRGLPAALLHDGIPWVILDEKADKGKWRGILEPCTVRTGGGVRVVDLRCPEPNVAGGAEPTSDRANPGP